MNAPARVPSFHPGEDLLFDYAAGTLGPSPPLLVATHVSMCPVCARDLAALEEAGGAMLSSLEPAPISDTLRDRVLGGLGLEAGPDPVLPTRSAAAPIAEGPYPEPLATWLREDAERLRWSRVVPGIRQMLLPVLWGDVPAQVVRFSRGIVIPRHTHTGRELTMVLEGELSDEYAAFGPGDVSDYDTTVEHRQKVTSRGTCTCLVVNEGHPVPKTMIGRILARIADV